MLRPIEKETLKKMRSSLSEKIISISEPVRSVYRKSETIESIKKVAYEPGFHYLFRMKQHTY